MIVCVCFFIIPSEVLKRALTRVSPKQYLPNFPTPKNPGFRNFKPINNCVAEWRWVPGMSRGFHLWHSQPLDRVTPPWLANPRPPAISPHANGTRHPSHWFNSGRIKGGRDGGKRMIERLNEENGRRENTVLSTWRRCKQGWPRLSQTTDRWPH